jgi:GNAT superfamily N-acetyltransferase
VGSTGHCAELKVTGSSLGRARATRAVPERTYRASAAAPAEPVGHDDRVDSRLRRHLASWLGQWPATSEVSVVGSARREQPGWDGGVRPLIGVGTPNGLVLSVPRDRTAPVRALAAATPERQALLDGLPEALGAPQRRVYCGVFRFSTRPGDLPDAGAWVPAGDPVVPDWLRVFGHQVLLAMDPQTGAYLAGVGLKRHDRYGWELAVGTEPEVRGRGLARRLVAQAARRVLDEGAVPTYQHAAGNAASAAVAEAAGFPDRGWISLGA